MLEINNKVALVVCSNGKAREDKIKLEKLEEILKSLGLVPVYSNYLYKDKFGRSANAKIRSEELMRFFTDKSIKAIFDISGGDLSNEILDYLDYDIIKKNIKPFFGYSDLSVVLNAITVKTGESTYLYQVLNIIGNENIRDSFKKTVMCNEPDLTNISWEFFQGEEISGIVAGGNIRCFLKLAGTQYFPDLKNYNLLNTLVYIRKNVILIHRFMKQIKESCHDYYERYRVRGTSRTKKTCRKNDLPSFT